MKSTMKSTVYQLFFNRICTGGLHSGLFTKAEIQSIVSYANSRQLFFKIRQQFRSL